MPAGRPTKYTPELIEKARDYINTFAEQNDAVIPSVAGLALRIGVRRETCHEWARDPEKAEFSNIIGEILAKQEEMLINNGLRGDFNAAIAKLALGKHGYTDKVDNTLSGGDKPLETVTSVKLIGVRPKHD